MADPEGLPTNAELREAINAIITLGVAYKNEIIIFQTIQNIDSTEQGTTSEAAFAHWRFDNEEDRTIFYNAAQILLDFSFSEAALSEIEKQGYSDPIQFLRETAAEEQSGYHFQSNRPPALNPDQFQQTELRNALQEIIIIMEHSSNIGNPDDPASREAFVSSLNQLIYTAAYHGDVDNGLPQMLEERAIPNMLEKFFDAPLEDILGYTPDETQQAEIGDSFRAALIAATEQALIMRDIYGDVVAASYFESIATEEVRVASLHADRPRNYESYFQHVNTVSFNTSYRTDSWERDNPEWLSPALSYYDVQESSFPNLRSMQEEGKQSVYLFGDSRMASLQDFLYGYQWLQDMNEFMSSQDLNDSDVQAAIFYYANDIAIPTQGIGAEPFLQIREALINSDYETAHKLIQDTHMDITDQATANGMDLSMFDDYRFHPHSMVGAHCKTTLQIFNGQGGLDTGYGHFGFSFSQPIYENDIVLVMGGERNDGNLPDEEKRQCSLDKSGERFLFEGTYVNGPFTSWQAFTESMERRGADVFYVNGIIPGGTIISNHPDAIWSDKLVDVSSIGYSPNTQTIYQMMTDRTDAQYVESLQLLGNYVGVGDFFMDMSPEERAELAGDVLVTWMDDKDHFNFHGAMMFSPILMDHISQLQMQLEVEVNQNREQDLAFTEFGNWATLSEDHNIASMGQLPIPETIISSDISVKGNDIPDF